jgi:hypothetical protein
VICCKRSGHCACDKDTTEKEKTPNQRRIQEICKQIDEIGKTIIGDAVRSIMDLIMPTIKKNMSDDTLEAWKRILDVNEKKDAITLDWLLEEAIKNQLPDGEYFGQYDIRTIDGFLTACGLAPVESETFEKLEAELDKIRSGGVDENEENEESEEDEEDENGDQNEA